MRALLPLLSATLLACAPEPAPESAASLDRVVAERTPQAAAILALLNDPATTLTTLDIDAALERRAATNLINYRNGRDRVVGTADDNRFDTLAEADAVAYVGDAAIAALLAYAVAHGYLPEGSDPYGTIEGVAFTWDEAQRTLILANTADHATLDVDVALDVRAANAIVAGRPFASLEAVANAAYVGRSALDHLRTWANAHALTAVSTADALAELDAATQGLLYLSESDYPLTVFVIENAGLDPVTPQNAKAKLFSAYVQRPGEATLAERAVEQRTIAQWFDPITVPEDWWDAWYYQQAADWQPLRDIFEQDLMSTTVIRLGESWSPPTLNGAIDVFVLGVTSDGDIVGFRTIAVET
ncbi:MAG TPA: nuclease A inhibitor family protein [Myxococcota bacterium]|nr:nuclease A inhibitor family protein [Myxococcota bacterium]